MSDTIPREMAEDSALNQAQNADFEALLVQAQSLLRDSKLDDALEQLLLLQEKYVAATRLFDMIADVYVKRGELEHGIRYKTLFKVLTGTLGAQSLSKPCGTVPSVPEPTRIEEGKDEEEAEPPEKPEFPPICTSEMAHEFLRQGHYEKALAQFNRLLEENPEKDALLTGRDTALKKLRERRLLGVLERWLDNIEHMKSGRTREHD